MPLMNAARELVARGGEATLYLQHPESDAASQRCLDMGMSGGTVAGEVSQNLSLIRSTWCEMNKSGVDLAKRFKVRLYGSLPAFALYRAGRRAWVSLYWYKNQAVWGSTLLLNSDSPLWG